MSLWNYISEIGYNEKHSHEEQRRIRLLVLLNVISGIVLIVYLFLEVLFKVYSFMPALCIMFCLIFIDLYLLKIGKYAVAKHFAILTVSSSISFISLYGGDTYGEALFIPLITMPLLVFQNKKSTIFYFVWILVLIVIIKNSQPAMTPLIDVTGETLLFFKIMNTLTAASVTYFSTYYFKASNEKYEEKLKVMHDTVAEKNKEITDSIRYAKRIQQTLMPTEKYIEKNFQHLNPPK